MNRFSIPYAIRTAAFAATAFAGIVTTQAAVVVTQGTTPTTTWSTPPAIGSANASFTASYGVGGEQLEQTITVGASSLTIDKILFSYGAPSMTGTLSLFIWQMGPLENPTAPGFVDNRGANLLSSNTFNFDTTGTGGVAAGSILTFDLTGSDEITLSANTSYVICLDFGSRTNNMTVGVTTAANDASSAYAGGALFYNEQYISQGSPAIVGNAGTDLAFAIYAVPETSVASCAIVGLGIFGCFARRRRNAKA